MATADAWCTRHERHGNSESILIVKARLGSPERIRDFFVSATASQLPATSMKACSQCTQKAEWRYKDGWGVLACADWFTGTCEGRPREVAPPSVEDLLPRERSLDEDEQYNQWVQTRLREVWPRERSNWTIELPTEPGGYWLQEDGSSRGILGEVRVTYGPLTVLWTNIDREEAALRARWRGPLRRRRDRQAEAKSSARNSVNEKEAVNWESAEWK